MDVIGERDGENIAEKTYNKQNKPGGDGCRKARVSFARSTMVAKMDNNETGCASKAMHSPRGVCHRLVMTPKSQIPLPRAITRQTPVSESARIVTFVVKYFAIWGVNFIIGLVALPTKNHIPSF
uniref:Uncharacterized protein n=1 Tax=Panagrellus redivivus TaxID=6233 RepID=A0A7E4UYH0_PANRE